MNETAFRKMIQSLADTTVVCYGINDYFIGADPLMLLRTYDLRPVFFTDTYRFGGEFRGLKVLSLKELLDLDKRESVSVVIFASPIHEIYDSLTINGFRGQVFVLPSYMDETNGKVFPLKEADAKIFFLETQKIRNRLGDAISQDILDALVEGRMTSLPDGYKKAFDLSVTASGKCQYFIKEIIMLLQKKSKGISFIDCGASFGDTIQSIVDLEIPLSSTYCFEPNADDYTKLCERIAELGLESCVKTVQAGVWSKNERLSFKSMDDKSHVTKENDEQTIDVVSLDSILSNQQVDMIKMDIEGSEMEALLGAMKTIKRERPILAICVYHKFFDLTKIPLFLMESLSNYNFLLRNHSGTLETVLYALPC